MTTEKRLYTLRELPQHLAHAEEWSRLERVLCSLSFLEEKAEAGMAFELTADLDLALKSLDPARPRVNAMRLFQQAIRADLHFLARHPSSLFQCLWNRCWWYNAPAAGLHYQDQDERNAPADSMSEQAPAGIHELLESWRKESERAAREFVWLRSLRPPPDPVGSPQMAVLRGHTCPVQSVAFSPDGGRIVSGSANLTDRPTINISARVYHGSDLRRQIPVSLPEHLPGHSIDNSVRIWDATSGEQLDYYDCGPDAVYGAAFSPEGNRVLFYGAKDGAAQILDLTQRKIVARFYGHTFTVARAAFSPDGLQVVSGSMNGGLRIWDARSGAELLRLPDRKSVIISLALSHDGELLATTSASVYKPVDGPLRIWNARTGETLAVVEEKQLPGAMSVAFSPDGRWVAVGSDDCSVRLYDRLDNMREVVLGRHRGEVLGLDFSRDGTLVVSGGNDRTVRVWGVACGGELACFEGHQDIVTSVAFSPDGQRVASASADCTIRIWDVTARPAQGTLPNHEDDVLGIEFSADGGSMVTCSMDGTVRVWSGEGLPFVSAAVNKGIGAQRVAITPDGSRVVASDDGQVIVLDAASGSLLHRLWAPSYLWEVTCLALSKDGRHVACGFWDGRIRIWDVSTGIELATHRDEGQEHKAVGFMPWRSRIVYGDEVTSLAFSPDGGHLVAGSQDGTLRIWPVSENQLRPERACTTQTDSAVRSVAVSHDGDRIASGGQDGTIAVWDLASCKVDAIYRGVAAVSQVAFSPDGFTLYACTSEQTLVLRERCVSVLMQGASDVRSMAATHLKPTWHAAAHRDETAVVGPDGEVVAWYPVTLTCLRKHPKYCVWAGAEGKHLHVFKLEGPRLTSDSPREFGLPG
jgi:WD40 repeat protein